MYKTKGSETSNINGDVIRLVTDSNQNMLVIGCITHPGQPTESAKIIHCTRCMIIKCAFAKIVNNLLCNATE